MKIKPLNYKQRKFVEEYLVNGKTGVDAAIVAGYSDKRNVASNVARRLLKQASIKEYISDIRLRGVQPKTLRGIINVAKEEANMIPDMFAWKVEKLVKIINANVPDNVEAGKEGKYQYGAAIAAIAELNKMQGHYSPTKTVNIDLKADVDMRRLVELSNKLLLEYKQQSEAAGVEMY